MPSDTLLLEIRRAEAEATGRVVRDWTPSDDLASRARTLETVVQEWVPSPKRLRLLVNDVLDRMPSDGTTFAYMNRQREALIGCFASTLDMLRATLNQVRLCEDAGQPIPSRSALEQSIRDAEQVRSDSLDHWTPFVEGEIDITKGDWIPDDQAFVEIESRLDERSRRELQSGLEQLRR